MSSDQNEPVRVLLAEDEPVSRAMITRQLEGWGYFVDAYDDGSEAMMAIRRKGAPKVAIIDWEMPGMDGLEICRRVNEAQWPIYILMLTHRDSREDLVTALDTGAHDFLVKPCDPQELLARLRVGERMISLQTELEARLVELQFANRKIRDLESLI